MIKIRDFIEKTSNDGNQHIIAELMIDSASELPSREYAGYVLDMGSIAWDISTGDFYALNSEGTWYKQDGSGAYTPETPDAEPDILEEPVEKTTTRKKTSETETKDDDDAV